MKKKRVTEVYLGPFSNFLNLLCKVVVPLLIPSTHLTFNKTFKAKMINTSVLKILFDHYKFIKVNNCLGVEGLLILKNWSVLRNMI